MVLCAASIGRRAAGAGQPLAPHVPGVVLVAFREGVNQVAAASVLNRFRLQVDTAKPSPYFARLTISPTLFAQGATMETVIEALRRDPSVRVAEPDYLVTAAAVPNDPRFSEQYTHRNTGQTGGTVGIDIGSVVAWDSSVGSDTEIVAVIDTGVDYNHPDLTDNILRDAQGAVIGFDFANNDADPMDDDGHGTHCAGIVGARGNNAVGITGVCQRVKIMPLKFLGPNGGTTSDAILAIDFATQRGVKVSSNSWGGPGFSQLLLDAILRARAAGQIFIAAAGNGGADGVGDNNDITPDYPSSFRVQADNVVSVAATDHRDGIASFSNFGLTTVDLGAPGVAILSTLPNNSYGLQDGTSMATPAVAGACALIRSQSPALTYMQLKTTLLANARVTSAMTGRSVTGARLDITRALLGISVTAPNGGELLRVGNPTTITWTSAGIPGTEPVRISLSRGIGVGFSEVIANSTPNTGSFVWTPTGPTNDHCRIRVSTIGLTPLLDTSDAEFRIVDGSMRVDAPNGGESVLPGDTLSIRWTRTGIAAPSDSPTVDIELSTDNGATWSLLFDSTPNDGAQDWKVVGGPTTGARIRVTAIANPDFTDASDASFEIREPTALRVTSPNGGEQLYSGQPITIRWETRGQVGAVRIDFSSNGGRDWQTLFENAATGTVLPNEGEIAWSAFGPVTRSGRLRVTALSDPALVDIGDGVFEIQDPRLKLTSPGSGQRVLVGETETIAWDASGFPVGAQVDVEVSRDSGATWENIATTSASAGERDWFVSGAPSINAFVRVSSVSDPNIFDVRPIAIAAPSIFLTAPVGRESWRVGSQVTISWSGTSVGHGTVDIELSRNGTKGPWETIAFDTPNDGGHGWGVRGKVTSKARLRIVWTSSPDGVKDQSRANFRIQAAPKRR